MADSISPFAALRLFTGVPQHEHFDRMYRLLPSRRLTASSAPHHFPDGPTIDLPDTFDAGGSTIDTEHFLNITDTAALLVLHEGAVVHEQYRLTGGPDVQWMSMSVAKSFISALVGIAVEQGHIRSIHDPISDYIDAEPGSAYDGVSIKDVLQMSSGARWNEDYSDPTSDIARLGAAMGEGGSLDRVPVDLCRIITERHRHRYEFNNAYRETFEKAGFVFGGTTPDGRLVELIEIPGHPFFIACQFHPEFQSKPNAPHPLFKGFIAAAHQCLHHKSL